MFRVTLAAALLLTFTACSDDASAPATTAADTAAVTGSTKLTPAEAEDLMAELAADVMIIDVRTPEEFAEGHIALAVNADLESGQFSTFIADLPKDAPYIVYCRSGRRSALAAQAMVDSGFTQVYDMGGLVDWEAAGFATVK